MDVRSGWFERQYPIDRTRSCVKAASNFRVVDPIYLHSSVDIDEGLVYHIRSRGLSLRVSVTLRPLNFVRSGGELNEVETRGYLPDLHLSGVCSGRSRHNYRNRYGSD